MRILVLNYEFPPVGGGGGRISEELSRALAHRGHQVRVQTSRVGNLPKRETRDGYEIFRSFSFRKNPENCTVFEMAAFLITNFLPTLKHIRIWKPDLIHIHFAVPTGVLGWLVHKITGVPYVITAHLGDVPGAIPEQTDRLFKIVKPFTVPVWKQAAQVTAVSDYVKDLAIKAYQVPVQTIFNGIEMPQKIPVKDCLAYNPRRLIFVGRFNEQKNLIFLIDLLARLTDLDWHFDLFGDGPQREAIQAQIAKRDLSSHIKMHGWQAPEVIKKYLAESDILLMPSLTEGLSLVAIEALFNSLCIVSSDIPGMKDVVKNNENGFLCPVNDLNAFEQALRRVLISDELLLSMKKASCARAGLFDLEKIVDQYEVVFKTVASLRRDRS